MSPMTGYMRDGFCHTGPLDRASHTVCAQMTTEFLMFSRWCLCVSRWEEAFLAGAAPPVILAATHELALDVVELNELQAHAVVPEK